MSIDPLVEPQFVFSPPLPSREPVYREIAERSAVERSHGDARLDLAYGPHPRERIDLFPGASGQPLLMFVHGGYWRSQHKENYAFVVAALRRLGLSVALVGYPLAPERPLSEIVNSLQAAFEWLHGPGRLQLPAFDATVVAGHSAGGHLAAMLASDPVLGPRIAGCVALSGLFDLAPLLRTSIGQKVRLDADQARALSPLQLAPGPGWLVAAFGAEETAPFRDQAMQYAARWAAGGGSACTLQVVAADHYSILREMMDERSATLRLLRTRIAPAEVGA